MMRICYPRDPQSIPLSSRYGPPGYAAFRTTPRTLLRYPKLSSDNYSIATPFFGFQAMSDGETQGCIHHDYRIRLVPVSHPNPGSGLSHKHRAHSQFSTSRIRFTSARNKNISEIARLTSAFQRWRRLQDDRHSLNPIQKPRPTLQDPRFTRSDTEAPVNEVGLLRKPLDWYVRRLRR